MSDKSSITKAFLNYRQQLVKAISAIVSADDIEDIVQETFIRSYAAELKQEIKFERTYMLKTARNLALNHVSSAGAKGHDPLHDLDMLPDDLTSDRLEKEVESKERFLHFCRATDTLSVEVKRVFLLKKVYGLSQKDIADFLGLSQSTVEKHVAKGLMQCAQYMKQVHAQGERVATDSDSSTVQALSRVVKK
ncbi:RNA polymerase sigma factor [Aestuariibacter halophilus]|uniref:RNA polymerase sigma factor n=1 Tax=Fluctibacter halophilus TaxID=226011 RepID=A0ABS8G751_9ALTE|nr:RNA polymerase sigma factor [Aestuariibacter halophilus]MCC2615504.1 RNA polymerase sigma factor [Aestuariibacter halophilus]